MTQTHYEVLGLDPSSSGAEIKRAYRRLSRELHPDVAGPDSSEAFSRVNSAHDVLSDPALRAEYDLSLGSAPTFESAEGRPSYLAVKVDGVASFINPAPLGRRGKLVVAALIGAGMLGGLLPFGSFPLTGMFAAVIFVATLIFGLLGATVGTILVTGAMWLFSPWHETAGLSAYWLYPVSHVLLGIGFVLLVRGIDAHRGDGPLTLGVRDAAKFFSWGTAGARQEAGDARSATYTARDLSSMVSANIPGARVVHGVLVGETVISHVVLTADRAVAITSIMAPPQSYRWGSYGSLIGGDGSVSECLLGEQAETLSTILGVPVLPLLAVRALDEDHLDLDSRPGATGEQMVYGNEVVGAVTAFLADGEKPTVVDVAAINRLLPLTVRASEAVLA